MSPAWIRAGTEGSELRLLVLPRASMSELAGVHDGRLRIRLAAPPVDGQANRMLLTFLAKTLGVAKTALTIRRGETGRRKRIRVAGVGVEALTQRVEQLIGGGT